MATSKFTETVDGAIHKAAGPGLVSECRRLNGCATGQSKITKGYDLPSRFVIHTVGPVYSASRQEECARLLASCYKSSLELASEYELKQIAFPAISTGVYGYPIEDATRIVLNEVREYFETNSEMKLDRLVFVVYTESDHKVYKTLIPEYFPPAVTED